MFKRPYTPSNHRTQNTTNNQYQNQNQNKNKNMNMNMNMNTTHEDSQRRQVEADRIYYEEIIVKQANARARLADSNNCCSRSGSSNITSGGSSFVDKFADFVTYSSRTSPMSNTHIQPHVPSPTSNATNAILPPNTNSSSNGNGSGSTSSNNATANNVAAVVSSSASNGPKPAAKKTPVILLAARGATKQPPLSILNGNAKAGTGSATGGVTLVRVNASNRNQRQVIVAPESVSVEQQQQPLAEEELLADDEELDDDDLDEDADALDALSSSTAQILRKFRIPKGTAVTAKSGDNYLAMPMPTPTPSPPGAVNLVSSGVEPSAYLENEDDIIEELNEDDLVEEIIDEEPSEEQSELQEATTTDGLDLSSTNNGATTTGATMLLAAPQPPPLQLQTVASNGTVTCFNLPPNTILLQSADGSIIAATQVPHPSKAGQHQLIALPGNVAMATNDSTAQVQATATPQATQTLLLTADGTAIPILATTPQQQQQQQRQQQQQQQQAAAAAAAQLFAA